MPGVVTCPSCGMQGHLPDGFAAPGVDCPRCGGYVPIELVNGGPPDPIAAPPKAPAPSRTGRHDVIDAFFSQMAGIQAPPPDPVEATATFLRSRPPVGDVAAERQWLEEELQRLDGYMARQFGLLRQQREEFARWRSEVEAALVGREQDLNRQDRLLASRKLEVDARESSLAAPADSPAATTAPVVQELTGLRQAIVEEQAHLDHILEQAAEQCRQADQARADLEQWQRDRLEQESLLQARHQQLTDREDELERKARHVEDHQAESADDDAILPTTAVAAEPSPGHQEEMERLRQAIAEQQGILTGLRPEVEQAKAAFQEWLVEHERMRVEQIAQAQAERDRVLQEAAAARDEMLVLLTQREQAVLSTEQTIQMRLAGLEQAAQVLARDQQVQAGRQAEVERREGLIPDLAATEARLLELKPLAEALQQEVDQQKAILQNIWQEAEKRVEETSRVQLDLERQAEALHEREALVRARHQETEQRHAELNQAEPVLDRRAQELREFERRIRAEFLDLQRRHAAMAQEQADELDRRRLDLEAQSEDLERRHRQLESRAAELEGSRQQLEAQVEEVERGQTRLEAQAADLARQRQEWENQMNAPHPLVAKLAEVNTQLRLSREREQLLRANQDVRTLPVAPNPHLVAKLAEVNQQLRDARTKLDQQAAAEKRAQEEVDRARREVQERRQELREEMHKNDELQRKVNELTRRLGI